MQDRVLCLRAAAKRLQVPERTLRYRASHGRVEGAFKQGKLWKFSLTALTSARQKEKYVRESHRNDTVDHSGGCRPTEHGA